MRRVLIALIALAALAGGAAGLAPLGVGATPAVAGTGSGGEADDGADLRVVNFNLLHGVFCDDGAGCQAQDRVDLFLGQLEEAACPPVVGLQEINDELRALVAERVPGVCAGGYEVVFGDVDGIDAELVLSSLPVRKARVLHLPGGLRRASRVVLDGPAGPIVLVVTHQDGDREFPRCRSDVERYRCPKPCPDGTPYPTCQTILGQRLAERGGPSGATRIYMGDFNVRAGTPRYAALVEAGWVDSHLAAGNPECDPATGEQCTAGREDQALAALKDPAAGQRSRIDFIFVKAPPGCTARFDPVADADGDGLGTGLFAATPAVDGPGGLVWPSDHTAVSMDLSCA